MNDIVSVIIPCYRDAATLGRAIESVRAQTYPFIEIVVVNDCSPETAEIEACLLRYPDVRYSRNPVNLGLAATRNAGIRLATGRVIALLDADDEYHPEKIAVQMRSLAPRVAVTCAVIHVHPDGRRQASALARPGQVRVVTDPAELIYRNTLNGAGLLIFRDLLLEAGLFDATLRSCEDMDLWLRLLSAGIEIRDVGDPLYLYHFNPAGLSKNFRNVSKWEIEVVCRNAARMGAQWCATRAYAATIAVWLLRHLMRSELTGDDELRRNTLENMNLLDRWPIFAGLMRLLARTRLMLLPAAFFRLSGRMRSR